MLYAKLRLGISILDLKFLCNSKNCFTLYNFFYNMLRLENVIQ